eukprot:9556443-Alexandrium_andersonii.AAC.1
MPCRVRHAFMLVQRIFRCAPFPILPNTKALMPQCAFAALEADAKRPRVTATRKRGRFASASSAANAH